MSDFHPPTHWCVAIDGPAASGKTTVARRLAQTLGYALIDTGAMYRAVALAALTRGIPLSDHAALETLAREESAHFEFLPDASGREGYRLRVGGVDVTDRLHGPRVSHIVPQVAAVSEVRRVLAAEQRRIGLQGGVVMTGRDIGTVVLPEAEIKVYLTASDEERARRRLRDLEARPDMPRRDGMSPEQLQQEILASLRERDHVDSSRQDSPLVQAADAVEVDSTALDLEQVVARIIDLMRARAAALT